MFARNQKGIQQRRTTKAVGTYMQIEKRHTEWEGEYVKQTAKWKYNIIMVQRQL